MKLAQAPGQPIPAKLGLLARWSQGPQHQERPPMHQPGGKIGALKAPLHKEKTEEDHSRPCALACTDTGWLRRNVSLRSAAKPTSFLPVP